ncbi:MAG: glycosyltransferase family 2 protein [Kiritimatiellae bacterium]|nr:glycosyltransferase family 2 protein [Kiritimatiellia bacterium]
MKAISAPSLSVVLPVYNEEPNVPALAQRLDSALRSCGRTYEVILVDDGSSDATWPALLLAARTYPCFRLIRFRRNFGQTAAMAAGFDAACGDIVVTLDADLQNPPEEIPVLLAKMDEGYDVVSGWRKNRQDEASRTIISRQANRILRILTDITEDEVHDFGCSLKAYRADVIKQVHLYGEMHRFVPALCKRVGARIADVPVQHAARTAGKSKYRISTRTLHVFLDLFTLRCLLFHATSPIHFFGKFGIQLASIGFAMLAFVGLEWLVSLFPHCGAWFGATLLVKRSFWIITPFMLIGFALQFILLGLIAELQIRTYHETQRKPIYHVRETFDSPR